MQELKLAHHTVTEINTRYATGTISIISTLLLEDLAAMTVSVFQPFLCPENGNFFSI